MSNFIVDNYFNHLKPKFFSKPLLKQADSIHRLILLAGILLSIAVNPAQAASLEIKTSQSINLPTLVYIESKNIDTELSTKKNIKHAQITSYLMTFKPHSQVLPVGTEIEVINEDATFHNTHIFNQGRTLFNIATPTIGVSVQRKLTRPGLFNVRCDLHPFMNAWIAIVNNNYYSFIEKAGVYNIKNIKPGSYNLHIDRSNKHQQIIAFDITSKEQIKKINLFDIAGNF